MQVFTLTVITKDEEVFSVEPGVFSIDDVTRFIELYDELVSLEWRKLLHSLPMTPIINEEEEEERREKNSPLYTHTTHTQHTQHTGLKLKVHHTEIPSTLLRLLLGKTGVVFREMVHQRAFTKGTITASSGEDLHNIKHTITQLTKAGILTQGLELEVRGGHPATVFRFWGTTPRDELRARELHRSKTDSPKEKVRVGVGVDYSRSEVKDIAEVLFNEATPDQIGVRVVTSDSALELCNGNVRMVEDVLDVVSNMNNYYRNKARAREREAEKKRLNIVFDNNRIKQGYRKDIEAICRSINNRMGEGVTFEELKNRITRVRPELLQEEIDLLINTKVLTVEAGGYWWRGKP